jgi:DNA mismatch repair protein MutS
MDGAADKPAELAHAANVHLDAVEHRDSIVFLHSVAEGPANQSYGLQVARLAGVPDAVVREARRHLAELEAHGTSASPQRDLFASTAVVEPPAEDHPVVRALRALDPDALTPRAALDALYALRGKLDS